MKINRINTNITFKENKINRDVNSENAILMLRDPKAAVKFQQSQEYARKADSIDTNPFVALGYKLYRSFNLITENSSDIRTTQFNKIA